MYEVTINYESVRCSYNLIQHREGDFLIKYMHTQKVDSCIYVLPCMAMYSTHTYLDGKVLRTTWQYLGNPLYLSTHSEYPCTPV